jgi:hypothetical protein
MRATASGVAPPGPKPVEVLTKPTPASTARRRRGRSPRGRGGRSRGCLDESTLGDGDDGHEVAEDGVVVAVLEGAEGDDDVELVGAVGDREAGLGGLDGGRLAPSGKPITVQMRTWPSRQMRAWRTRVGWTHTLANPWTRASSHRASICAVVAPGAAGCDR